ncbi:cystathionine gamma-synthase [Dysgonomonas sp. BGC7]|uniref:cystathionine gamma-synthase n=1 Tax=Dysgonomonas sp. BGC7 TaxID=1658008 RepID=UPI0006828E9F|nr:cystathionine gamma-synthase [Dysgonomonas sp. BGC7]MBD8388383.1 cystathionine gamma-synthase [Dysgonomonas sp. BGC7]
MGNIYNQYGFETKAIHVGEKPNFREGATGDVIVPIHLSTTFAREKVEEPTAGYEYTRSLNPTRKALEEKLAALENANYALAFSSGLAAESSVIIALLKAGDHIVASDDLYGGTKRLFNKVFSDFEIEASYADFVDLSSIEKSIKPNTKMIWLESPTNPLLKLSDISAISSIAKRHNLILVVDNTFLSPYFQNPLSLGADVVLHSSTKYIGGHSDVLGGSVMVSDDDLYQKLQYYQNAVGAVLSPFDSYLTIRGIKTLGLRMKKHEENALLISRFLENHPRVTKVIYPGLESHPQYKLSKKQSKGSGGIISFEIKGQLNDAKHFLESLHLFALAESLGGVESLIELPALMTHASVSKEEREEIGITDTLIRLSVGIEEAKDLISDLENALDNYLG